MITRPKTQLFHLCQNMMPASKSLITRHTLPLRETSRRSCKNHKKKSLSSAVDCKAGIFFFSECLVHLHCLEENMHYLDPLPETLSLLVRHQNAWGWTAEALSHPSSRQNRNWGESPSLYWRVNANKGLMKISFAISYQYTWGTGLTHKKERKKKIHYRSAGERLSRVGGLVAEVIWKLCGQVHGVYIPVQNVSPDGMRIWGVKSAWVLCCVFFSIPLISASKSSNKSSTMFEGPVTLQRPKAWK